MLTFLTPTFNNQYCEALSVSHEDASLLEYAAL